MNKSVLKGKVLEFNIKLPTASDKLGQWMEKNGASVEMHCMLGEYTVTVGMKKLHSYNDERGEHAEVWSISRHDRDPEAAWRSAILAAMEIRP